MVVGKENVIQSVGIQVGHQQVTVRATGVREAINAARKCLCDELPIAGPISVSSTRLQFVDSVTQVVDRSLATFELRREFIEAFVDIRC